MNIRESEIIEFIKKKQECSSKDIYEGISSSASYATVKRILSKLTTEKLITTKGQGKGTKYLISSVYELLQP
ncbi:MAG: BlaI/MecI/CopY family transcriptional regulator, partial [Bacteroidota bacterium]|nr:BlaI/MecI/CopY family transcriptional regulator [Bacteroidota bacterium]